MSGFIKELAPLNSPFYTRLITGDNRLMPEVSGKDAIFDGGGSMSGTFVYNSTNTLKSFSDYLYTTNGASNTDYFGYVFDTNQLSREFGTMEFQFLYKTASADFQFVVKDVTNSTIISTALIPASTNTFKNVFNIPVTCLQLKIGIKYIGSATGVTFQLDNLMLNIWNPQAVNLIEEQSVRYTGKAAAGGGSATLFSGYTYNFTTNLNLTDSKGSGFFSVSGATITILKPAFFTFSLTSAAISSYVIWAKNQTESTAYASIPTNMLLNGTKYQTGGNYGNDSVAQVQLNAGDTVRFHCSNINCSLSDYGQMVFSIHAQAVSTNVLQTWQDGRGSFKSLTYTEVNALSGNQGLGTFTAGSVEYMIGADGLLHYKGKLTLGTVSASEIRIPYPNGFIAADTTKIPSIQLAGKFSKADSSAGFFGASVLVEPSVGYFTVGNQTSSTNDLTKATGVVFSSGAAVSFNFTVPVQGVSSTPTLLALPTATQTDYYLEAVGNAGQAITANVTDIPFIATTQNNLTWDGSGFTAPISGNYEVVGMVYSASAWAPVFSAYVNTTKLRSISYAQGNAGGQVFNGKIYLLAGQRLSLRSDSTVTLTNNTNVHHISITRLNGKNDGVFVGTVAKNQVAYLRDVKASGTAGGSSVAGHQVRTLNTVDGDSSIVSLSSNQFTLGVGEYTVKARTPAFYVGYTQCYLRKTSDGATTPTILGSSAYPNAADTAMVDSKLQGRLSLSTATTFELKQWANAVRASNGLGIPAGSGLGEVYSEVEITKLNGQ